MPMKKTLSLVLVPVLVLLLSSGLVLAAEVDCDSVYCFSTTDFSENPNLAGVCITQLPDSNLGTVMLGSRVVRSGDILTAQQLTQLTFVPLKTEADQEVTITYLPIYENRVETAATVTISIWGKKDQAPVAQDSTLETYKNLANQGKLTAHDPEGCPLQYTLTRAPKRGTVTIHSDGTFTYTPKKNKVGTDSFTYTVTDPAGNVSQEATVTIQVLKTKSTTTYADTLGKDCRFAAEWLKNTGLFTGETINGQICFQPEKTMTRGEFTAMLVQALGLRVDEDASYTGFTDECPSWLKPYLAAALRSGLTAGWPHGENFGPEQTITGAEAALLIQNALDLTVSAAAMEAENTAVAVMAENGIALNANGILTRADAAVALYQVRLLAPNAPGMQVLAQQ